ncbi:MAG: Rv3654c family TadE-like protein, partial [Rhodoglobus sp.]
IAGGLAALSAASLPVYGALATRQSVVAAADASALAAADVAVGIAAGFPCEAASRVAVVNGASVVSCRLDGLVATVTVSRWILGIPVTATATAGPPG